MDGKKAAFIVCTNDAVKMKECDFYIDSLRVPDGVTIEKCYVEGAPSMAAGYNAGMRSSDAKYKFYLHHDVLLLERDMIEKTIRLFSDHPETGLLGTVGCITPPKDAHFVTSWDYGAVLTPRNWYEKLHMNTEQDVTEVSAVDGLLMITQYDVPWREDLFQGWDFYDISQSYEFQRAGYRVGVPAQDPVRPWAFHDTEASNMGNYYDVRQTFRTEYADQFEFSLEPRPEDGERQKRDAVMTDFYGMICEKTGTADGREEAVALLKEYGKTIYGHAGLNVLKKAGMIHREEISHHVPEEELFWKAKDTADALIAKIREVNFAVKRAEFGVDKEAPARLLSEHRISETALATGAVLMVTLWEPYLHALGETGLLDRQKPMMKDLMDRIFSEDSGGLY